MNTIQEKINLYQQAKEFYYNPQEGQEPIMSDEEFDALEEELIDAGFDPFLGHLDIENGEKIKHNVKMLSLQKVKVLDDTMPIETAIEIFDKYGVGSLSWKYDGLALEAQYKNGQLVALCTRGNGDVGRNVMNKFKHLVPNKINWLKQVDVRFEAVMNENLFKAKYSDKYKHSRTLVSGIFGDININDERKYDIDVKVLEIIDVETLKLMNPINLGDWFIQKYKEHKICYSASDVKQYFDQSYANRSEYDFGTDGMVYTSKDQITYDYKGKYPTYATAIKFKPPRLISTITDIQWNLNRTGRYTPIIKFQPIIVDGRSIKQASGYNFAYLVENDLTIGKQVEIVISNDIIPMVKPIK